jgi:hypothetical protein
MELGFVVIQKACLIKTCLTDYGSGARLINLIKRRRLIMDTQDNNSESIMTVDEDGDKIWRDEDDNYHREDGPAIEHAIGLKSWYIHGVRHREDGPAVVWSDGKEAWFIDGKLYPEDSLMVQLLKEKICRSQC